MRQILTLLLIALLATVNAQAPTAIIFSNPAASCGGSVVLTTTVSGGQPPYKYKYYQIGFGAIDSVVSSATFHNKSVLITATSGYSVKVMNQSNPTQFSTDSVMIALLMNPTVTASPQNTTVCAGKQVTLTAAGASSYLWSNNATTPSIVVTPVATTNYTVTGSLPNGCAHTVTTMINVVASTSLNGNLFSSLGSVTGSVTLFKFESFSVKFDSLRSVAIFNDSYSFANVPAGNYIVKALPSDKRMLDTYGTTSVIWKGASVVQHSCNANSSQIINVMTIQQLPKGPGALAGTIREGDGYKKRGPGNPIGGVVVKGGKNPGGNIVSRTTTAPNGTYRLDSLPANAAGESYFLIVDIAGLDTTQSYHRVILNDEQLGDLDFIVDSNKIVPKDLSVGLAQIKNEESSFVVYPNPSCGTLWVSFYVPRQAAVSGYIYDLSGRRVMTLVDGQNVAAGPLSILSSVEKLESSVYFVELQIGEERHRRRLIIE